ncbi:D-Ala-D-Ala carboxypeptidase family metallohydrolase [Roseibium sp. HPY-6]|uniref:D-Ala-D-Ala carboxypeptidase family metallohydrolase n=1 Tax=Roseibium sp. HPY-6 TaxID=3229852 RepID=UPI00338F810C
MVSENANSGENLSEILTQAESATDYDDLKKLQAQLRSLLTEGFVPADKAPRAFAPALEMTPEFRAKYFTDEAERLKLAGFESGFGGFIGDVAIDVANALASAERRVAYRLKTLFGFDGIRLVEEGDSWTQYPVRLQDIVDQLGENSDMAIYSVGAAGDLVSNMAAQKQYLKALRKTGAAGMILSGGGNDFFGEFEKILIKFTSGAKPAELINASVFDPVFNTVMSSFQTILSDVATHHPGVTVFGHGYDLPFPQDDGNWIGPALINKEIPLDLGRDILKVIMDRFNVALKQLASDNANFVVSDLRGKVDRGPNSWFDELHPKNAGYGRAAAIIEDAIRARLEGGTEAMTSAPALEGAEWQPAAEPIGQDGASVTPTAIESSGDGSNGHMIAGYDGEGGDGFLWALARSEARFAGSDTEASSGTQTGPDECGELFDEDPDVALAFTNMGSNVELNFGFLKKLFDDETKQGGTAAVPLTAGGFDHKAFIDFIESLSLRHFTPAEFLVLGGNNGPGGKGEGLNTLPPRTLWPNIANTARMLDEIRDRLGTAVFISSAYRSPAYNEAIGGKTSSQHLKFSAFDWAAASGSVEHWRDVARSVRADNPAWIAGIGFYPGVKPGSSKFIHVDTGFKARDWTG